MDNSSANNPEGSKAGAGDTAPANEGRPGKTLFAKRRGRDWALLAVLIMVWGASFGLTKIAVQSIAPPWVAALRISLGAAILIAVLAVRGERLGRGGARHWAWYFWLGLTGSVAPFFLISWGTQYIASGLAGILMAAVPLVVIALAHFLLPDEPMTRGRFAGFVTGFAGVVFLIGPDALARLGVDRDTVLAQLAVLAATACYATTSVTARLAPPMSLVEKSAGVLTAAALTSTTAAIIAAPQGLSAAEMPAILAVVALGVFPTALATFVLFRLLETAGAGFVSLSNYLIPAFAVAAGIVFLGEQLAWQDFAGFALLIAGVGLAEFTKPRGG